MCLKTINFLGFALKESPNTVLRKFRDWSQSVLTLRDQSRSVYCWYRNVLVLVFVKHGS